MDHFAQSSAWRMYSVVVILFMSVSGFTKRPYISSSNEQQSKVRTLVWCTCLGGTSLIAFLVQRLWSVIDHTRRLPASCCRARRRCRCMRPFLNAYTRNARSTSRPRLLRLRLSLMSPELCLIYFWYWISYCWARFGRCVTDLYRLNRSAFVFAPPFPPITFGVRYWCRVIDYICEDRVRSWPVKRRHWCNQMGLDSLFQKAPIISAKNEPFSQDMHSKILHSSRELKLSNSKPGCRVSALSPFFFEIDTTSGFLISNSIRWALFSASYIPGWTPVTMLYSDSWSEVVTPLVNTCKRPPSHL